MNMEFFMYTRKQQLFRYVVDDVLNVHEIETFSIFLPLSLPLFLLLFPLFFHFL